MIRDQICYWTLGLTMAIGASGARAAIIDDASFFDDIPHTFVDFETRDDGSPLPLTEGQFAFAPLDEYFEVGFVAFRMNIAWEWSADPDVQQALTEGATPTKLLRMFPNNPNEPYGLLFVEDQHSVGFFFTRDTSVADNPISVFAKDRQGVLIESITVVGDLVDGNTGTIEYGYVGFTSSKGIATISFSAPNIFAFGIDDFRFSQVPAPGAMSPFVLFALRLQRRRR